jgi:hypothetical protein
VINTFGVEVYPNPSTEHVFINHPFNDRMTTIEIRSMDGRMLLSEQLFIETGQNARINLNRIPSGVYLFTITSGSNRISKSIIKE